MTNILTDQTKSGKGINLTNKNNIPFKISIESKLDNNFEFCDLNNNGIKEFHNFLKDTVCKNLTISLVEKQFLRKKGVIKNKRDFNGEPIEEIHLGKDMKKFRIFGYYKSNYFVITKIDQNHDTHKE